MRLNASNRSDSNAWSEPSLEKHTSNTVSDSSYTFHFGVAKRSADRTAKRGRPTLDSDVRALILKMADANPLWGAPKIHGELLKLGVVISERTVSGVLRRHKRKPPSQTWRTFIKNHMPDMVGVVCPNSHEQHRALLPKMATGP